MAAPSDGGQALRVWFHGIGRGTRVTVLVLAAVLACGLFLIADGLLMKAEDSRAARRTPPPAEQTAGSPESSDTRTR